MAGLRLGESIARVDTQVARRLAALERSVPPLKREPELPFAEYLVRARAQAAVDPVFRRQLADALRQYEAVQGGLP